MITAYVESRGYHAKPILNTDAATQGLPLRVMGYELRGPRGNKTVITGEDMFVAKLWCDGVDYATRKMAGDKQ